MKSPKCCNKFMELKCAEKHLLNGCGQNAYCLFFQCKKCGEIEIIKNESRP